MTFSLSPWQLAKGRAPEDMLGGAQYMLGVLFIVYSYSHVHIPFRHGSHTYILIVTRYWQYVITREG